MKTIFLFLILFSEGLVVAGGISAFLTLLDVIPRLCQISRSYYCLSFYEYVILFGAVSGSIFSLSDISFNFSIIFFSLIGLGYGVFIGFLAGALAEAVDVIPVMERRLKLNGYVKYLLFAIIFGKLMGSIFQWLIFEK